MDWENKFYSIVKETQNNLAKAKEKLSSKSVPAAEDWSLNTGGRYAKHIQHHHISLPVPEVSNLNMNTDCSMQMFHLQEQINSQNKTIEKLEKLVISLNNERNYYKEQISQLKGEIDHVTDRMNSQFPSVSSERQIFTMKRELMNEIEKVKSMLQNYAHETSSLKKASLSSTQNDDIWAIKENLTENIEQVHRELTAVNKRIERLESQIAADPTDRLRHSTLSMNASGASQYQRVPTVYTPGYLSPEDTNSLQLQQLRQTIKSLNSKLESLENKLDTANVQQPSVVSYSGHSRRRNIPAPPGHSQDVYSGDDNDVQSLSDLSDISSFSGNMDALTLDLRDGRASGHQRRKPMSSGFESCIRKTGRGEFSLSDSDIDDDDDDDDDDDLEIDSLDLL